MQKLWILGDVLRLVRLQAGELVSEKPLHVEVAEALGWTEVEPFSVYGVVDPENWCGNAPDGEHTFLPDYDTDWSATGPLIERFGITLKSPDEPWNKLSRSGWQASWSKGCPFPHYESPTVQEEHEGECECVEDIEGVTPLVAVCRLILALKAAGKL